MEEEHKKHEYKSICSQLPIEEVEYLEKLIKDFNTIKGTKYTKNSFIRLCIKLVGRSFYKSHINN